MGPFSGSIMSSVFHNNSEMTKLGDELVFKSKKSPPNGNDGNVGGLNFTPRLVNPLVPLKLSLIMESCAIFMVNPNFKYGVIKP